MVSPASQFGRASFDGIEFPFRSRKVSMSNRIHEHIYLKIPGAAIEKMGRGLYRCDFDTAFDANVPGYTDLYPGTLGKFRALAESQKSAPLTIPGIGTIQATFVDWDQEYDVKIRSGEKSPFHFLEDATQLALADALTQAATHSVQQRTATLMTLAAPLDQTLRPGRAPDFVDGVPDDDLFTKIQRAANVLLGARDTADLYGNWVAAKVGFLTDLVQQADRDLVALQDPLNYPVVDALRDLLFAAIEFEKTLTGTNKAPRIYVVPMTMSLAQISADIYDGDGTRGGDIMLNNAIRNPFSVPAGEQLLYFAA